MRINFKKKYFFPLLISLLLITLLNGAFLIYAFNTNTSKQTITLTKDGFSPSEVSVSQYTPITFINKDNTDRWPASNPHPTHTDYPELDPQQPLPPGTSWTFTPDKVGSWKFHDHFFPHQGGKIIVKGQSLLNKLIAAVFKGQISPTPTLTPNNVALNKQNSREYNAIKEVADNEGLEAAWRYVIRTYSTNNEGQLTAHDYAHFVGQLIFAKRGLEGLSTCTPEFAFGCYHGVLDAAFKTDLSQLPAAEKACSRIGKVNSGPYASCVHGIGHGVASYYNEKDLPQMLRTCETLPPSGRTFCFDGVFMELSRNAVDSFYRKDDPLFPCTSLEAKYQYTCGRNQPSVLAERFQKSYQEIATICESAKKGDLRTACFVSLGFQAVYKVSSEPDKIIGSCHVIDDKDFQFQCTSAAAGELIFQNMANWQINAPYICNSLTDEELKTSCLEHLRTIEENYNRH